MSDNQWDPTDSDKTQVPPDNVADMEKARIKADAKLKRDADKAAAKTAEAQGDKPLSDVQMAEMLTLRMADDPVASRLMPAPSERIAVVLSADSKRRPLEFKSNGVCRYIDLTEAAGVLLRYCHQIKVHKKLWSYGIFHWRHAKAAADFWLSMSPPIAVPPPFRLDGDDGPCFQRIPFKPVAGPTPLFDGFVDRMIDYQRRPFMAWCGSLYFLDADRQQYLWLWGPGGDGKGAWARHLQRVFGSSALAQATAPDAVANKHCYVPYENKRLVVYPELLDPRAVERLKSLTGGDRLRADPKHSNDGYDFDPVCKLLILSNRQPSITSQRSDVRRPIIVEMISGVLADPQFEAALWEERAAIAHKCIETYREMCPRHGSVPLADAALDAARALGSMLDEEFEMRFEQLFNRNGAGWCLPDAFQRQLNYVEAWRRDRKVKLRFATWLAEAKGIRKRSVRDKGAAVYAYVGITPKDMGAGFGGPT